MPDRPGAVPYCKVRRRPHREAAPVAPDTERTGYCGFGTGFPRDAACRRLAVTGGRAVWRPDRCFGVSARRFHRVKVPRRSCQYSGRPGIVAFFQQSDADFENRKLPPEEEQFD